MNIPVTQQNGSVRARLSWFWLRPEPQNPDGAVFGSVPRFVPENGTEPFLASSRRPPYGGRAPRDYAQPLPWGLAGRGRAGPAPGGPAAAKKKSVARRPGRATI